MKRLFFYFVFIISMTNANCSNFRIDRDLNKNDYIVELNKRYDKNYLLYSSDYSLNNQLHSTSLLTSEPSKQGLKYGYVAAPIVLGLSIASEITKKNQIPAMPLCISAVVITAISVPIISTNARSLNSDWKRVKTASWVAYGGGMLCAGVLISTGIMNLTPPTPVIAVTGIMCASSIVLMTHCTKYSNNALSNNLYKKTKLNFGVTPLKNGGICTLALHF